MKRKEKFQWLPKELHQLKYEAISVPQGSVRLVKKDTRKKKFNLLFVDHQSLVVKVTESWQMCYNIGHSTSENHRVGKAIHFNYPEAQTSSSWCGVVVERRGCQLRYRPCHLTMVQKDKVRRKNFRVVE
ncbi:hypothetical protein TNCV_2539911 [Trichonephila clavipes]|nr:hypothetical protein TNCV_2539911 [Trichonephila clavipes]